MSTRRETPTTSFRKCHIIKAENSSPKGDSNPHSSIGCRPGSRRANRYTTRLVSVLLAYRVRQSYHEDIVVCWLINIPATC